MVFGLCNSRARMFVCAVKCVLHTCTRTLTFELILTIELRYLPWYATVKSAHTKMGLFLQVVLSWKL